MNHAWREGGGELVGGGGEVGGAGEVGRWEEQGRWGGEGTGRKGGERGDDIIQFAYTIKLFA